MLTDAIELFQSCLKGVGEGDADIMLKLAQTYFANDDFKLTIQTLDDIITSNPQFNSTDGHLLYARSLEKLERFDEAIKEYQVVSENFPGEEGRVRYGLLLLKRGETETANKIFELTISRSRLAPKFYQKKEKYWIRLAKSNLR